MNIIQKYTYPVLERVTQADGKRHYICPTTQRHLTSVTTILSATGDKTGLLEWKRRVGEAEARRISQEAVGLGSLMHTHLECHILGQPRPTGNNLVRQQAEAMADQIIQYGLPSVDEVWGSEIALWYPEMYAGTTDLVGVHEGDEAIMDFKTARKMKKKQHIEDYFLQMTAYAMAHNELHGTDIKKGVIFMVDRDFNYSQFVIEGAEFQDYTGRFINRLETYLMADAA